MSPTEAEKAVHDFLDAWNSDDWARLEALHDPDVISAPAEGWPETPESGVFEGWEAIRGQYERNKDSWERERVELLELEAVGDRALAKCHWIVEGRGSGIETEMEVWVLVGLRDGRMARIDFSFDEAIARQAASVD